MDTGELDGGTAMLIRAVEAALLADASGMSAIVSSLPRLVIGLVDDDRWNALADISCGQPVVAINTGIPIRILNLLIACFSDPGIFPGVGRRYESEPIRLGTNGPSMSLYNQGKIFDNVIGTDRLAFAFRLTVMLTRYVALHEFVHIRNGHVDLVKSSQPLLAMEENQDSVPGVSNLDFQAMEWDADNCAMLMWLTAAIEAHQIQGYNKGLEEGGEHLHALFTTGLLLLWRLTEAIEPASDEPMEQHHPPALVRSNFVIFGAGRQAKAYGLPAFDNAHVRALHEVNVAWARLTGQPVPTSDQVADAAEAVIDHNHAIIKHWDTELRPRLVPLNRGNTELSHFHPEYG
ncbi:MULTISPECIES: hypothetical protein [unclassified Mesorhizobium]|uniref:hypothetical protein n=1 Tax=unclassified Mesorhizobium TaxID=325217 RepID=UPI00112EA1DF|nr:MULTISPECIES: hypothetical protein [unclassified Mesorhizobium]MBZ9704595.1 hypothetical protein [Mesorhizobium sp. CO1-1-3]MBZ9950355.1 hypothetical protein [Mesorhizobium sp. BR1-1-11]TPI98021.1 hypothetical protein FJ428_25215 [Mesorhizobium sp. B2-8-1]